MSNENWYFVTKIVLTYCEKKLWAIAPHCFGLLVLVRSLPTIYLWNKCIDLTLFLKCKEGPFLRPLRSKDDLC